MLLVEQQSPCPECGGKPEVDYAHGEVVCAGCGLVTQDRLIDGRPESVPDEEFIPRETYVAPSLHVGGRDARGGQVNWVAVAKLDRAQFWYARKGAEQDIEEMAARILRVVSELGMQRDVAERAIWLYTHLERKGHKRRQVVALGLSLTVARERRIPLTLAELTKFLPANVRRKAVVDMHYEISRQLSVENGHLTFQESLQAAVNAVGGDFEVLSRARQIAAGTPCPEKLAERLFAAACVFVALRERDRRISESAFSRKIGLSEISLRKGCALAGLTTGRREVVPAIDLSAIA